MNQSNQAASSSAPQFLPVKRKRGRPRKDQSLKRVEIARVPPGFEGVKENKSRQADKIDDTSGGMVGQAVTGVIEAAFDAGYLLSVRIGNSNTNLRGIVFKSGNYVPVTAQNDVAPHVQMIKRNEICFPVENQVLSNNTSRARGELNGASHVNQGERLQMQSANVVASKFTHTSPTAASSTSPLGDRGTVVPVVLQPASLLNGSAPTNQAFLDASVSRDKDVVTAEPLAMLLPDGSSSSSQFLAVKNQQLSSQLQTGDHVTPGSVQNANGSTNGATGVVGEKEEAKNLKVTNIAAPGGPMVGIQGSSQSLDTNLESSKSSAEISRMELDQEISNIQSPYAPKPVKNYGGGRMTELLQALQENLDHPVAGSGAESHRSENPDLNLTDEAEAK